MSELLHYSNTLKNEADILLSQTGIADDLSKYGKVNFFGAYAGNVMMHGDIDVTVVRDNPYSAEEILNILKALYLKGKFRSYFIKGDWDDERKGNEFPHGHYIGMKQRLNGEKWKVDVWFVDKEESENRNKNLLDIASITLTEEQREVILEIKKYRMDNKLDISGQQIYEAVLNKGVGGVDDFKNTLQ